VLRFAQNSFHHPRNEYRVRLQLDLGMNTAEAENKELKLDRTQPHRHHVGAKIEEEIS